MRFLQLVILSLTWDKDSQCQVSTGLAKRARLVRCNYTMNSDESKCRLDNCHTYFIAHMKDSVHSVMNINLIRHGCMSHTWDQIQTGLEGVGNEKLSWRIEWVSLNQTHIMAAFQTTRIMLTHAQKVEIKNNITGTSIRT